MLFPRLAEERGVALPVALAVLFVTAGLATVAARGGIVSNNQSFRDKNAKRAMQAANAGLQAAVYQTNLMQPAEDQCVLRNTTTGALSNGAVAAGWCAAQTEDLGDGASYSMQISSAGTPTYTSSGLSVQQRTVVSTGIVNNVRRRATVSITASTGTPIFPPGYVATVRDAVTMHNNAVFEGHIGSNGTVTIKNNASVCGDVMAGPGKALPKIGNNFVQCSGYKIGNLSEEFDLQPVDLSGPKAANNNDRLSNLNSPGKDTCTSCNKISWNTSTRVLSMTGGTLALSGDTYLVCRINFTGGTLQIPYRTKPLEIYIDAPQNCGGTTGMGSAVWDADIQNLYSPAHALKLLMAGSSTKTTTLDLPPSTVDSPVGVYAPNTAVTHKNNVEFVGALVAKSLTLLNNAEFTWHSAIDGLVSGSDIRFYQAVRGSYKECTSAATTSTPTDGC